MLPHPMLATFFGQTFAAQDLLAIFFLILLEGALSVDNALVLGLMAKRLPPEQRQKALTYGLVGAFVFRFASIGVAVWLLAYPIVKLLGGAYLIYIAVKHFVSAKPHDDEDPADAARLTQDAAGRPHVAASPEEREQLIEENAPVVAAVGAPAKPRKFASFWPTVIAIELTDIAFAVDSILAALAFVPPVPAGQTNPKLWVVMLGGFIGVMLMRVAAVAFIKLLERFPRFEMAAYLLVTVIGLKLVIDWAGNKFFATPENPHPIDFHSPTGPAFWAFWVSMLICFGIGFIRNKPAPTPA